MRGVKPPTKGRPKDPSPRPPLSENGQAENIGSQVTGEDEDKARLKSLNIRLVREINDERVKNRTLKMNKEAFLERESTLKDEIAGLVSEKNYLETEGLRLKEEMQEEYKQKILQVENQVRERANKELEEEILKKEKEWQTTMLESQIRLKEEMIKKEEECQAAMSERNDLQIRILELKEQLKMMCEQTERDHMARDSEKEDILSEIFAVRKDKEEIERGYELLQEKFGLKEEESKATISEKEKREDKILELQEQLQIMSEESKKRCMSVEAEKQKLLAEVSEVRKKIEVRDRSNATLQERLANKEEEFQAVISETKNLQNEILILKEQMHMTSKESNATQITLEAEKDQLLSQVLAAKNDAEAKSKINEILLEKMAKKEEEFQTVISEKNHLEALSEELKKACVSVEAEKQKLLAEVSEVRKKIAERDISNATLQERLANKEEEFQTVISETKNLQNQILMLKEQMHMKSKESEATQITVEAEKDKLLSQVLAAKNDAEDKAKSYEILLEEMAKKEEEFQMVISEKSHLEAMAEESKKACKSVEAEKWKLLAEVSEVRKKIAVRDRSNATLQERLASKEEEFQAGISEIKNLQNENLMLKEQLHMVSKESEATQITLEAEKDQLLSQVLAARNDAEDKAKRNEILLEKMAKKEEEFQTAISGKHNLEAKVLQFQEQLDIISKELETTRTSLEAEKNEMDLRYELLQEELAKKEKECHAMNSEKNNFKDKIILLKAALKSSELEKDQLLSQFMSARKDAEDAGKINETLHKKVAIKEEECQDIILEKESLGAEILQLKEQMKIMCEETEVVQRSYDAEKDQLLSQVMTVRKESEEMGKRYEILQGQMEKKEDECRSVMLEKTDLEATFMQMKEKSESAQLCWEAEKDKLSSLVLSARKDAETIRVSYEMLQKAFEAEKENLLSELSRCEEEAANTCKKNETVKRELSQKYEQVYIETEFLKAQLNQCNAILVSVEDESKMNVERLEAVLAENRTSKEEIYHLQLNISETNDQLSDLNHKYEASLKERFELRKETDKTRCSLERHIRRVEEQTIEIVGLKNQIQELRASLHDLQEKHAKELQEKGLLSKDFDSLHTEFTQKCSEFDEKESKLLKENEGQRNMMESLLREKAILGSEKANVECILEGATKRCEEFQEKYLQSNVRVSELEGKISELHGDLAASRNIYGVVTGELNNVKELFNKQQDEICQFKKEKTSLDLELSSHISTNRALKEDFLSAKSSLAELQKQLSRLKEVKNNFENENNSLQAEVNRLALALEQKNQNIKELESSRDHLNKDIQGKAISTSKLMPKQNKKQQMMNCSWPAWVASAFAVAGVAITAYLKLSKEGGA